jgi:hypothetical protein
MRRRSHWGTLTGWNSSPEFAKRNTAPSFRRLAASGRIHRCVRTGALLAVISLIRIARVMRSRGRLLLLLAGGVLAVAGIALSSWIFIPGMLVILLAVRIQQDSSTAFTDPALMPFLVDTQTGHTQTGHTRTGGTRTGRPPAR